jgi:hypothetical protein
MKNSHKMGLLVVGLLLTGLLLANWQIKARIDHADWSIPHPFYEPVDVALSPVRHLVLRDWGWFTLVPGKKWGLRVNGEAKPYLKIEQKGDQLTIWFDPSVDPVRWANVQAAVVIEAPATADLASITTLGRADFEAYPTRRKVPETVFLVVDSLQINARDSSRLTLNQIQLRALTVEAQGKAEVEVALPKQPHLYLSLGEKANFWGKNDFGKVTIRSRSTSQASATLNAASLLVVGRE